jgi:hypothetical protein
MSNLYDFFEIFTIYEISHPQHDSSIVVITPYINGIKHGI